VISTQSLSALLDSLYAAPLEEASWNVFLTGLCAEMQARQCFYVLADSLSGPRVAAQGGPPMDTPLQRRYNEEYGRIDPYGPALARKTRTAPILADEVVDRRELERSDFHQLVLAPFELSHAIFLPAVLKADRFEALTIWRSLRQGPFDQSSAQLLELLLPHVQSALRTRRVLAAAGDRAARAEAALDAVATPTFLLDARSRVVHHNAAAEALLASADGLALRERSLVARDPRSHEALQAAIHAAVTAGSALPSRPSGAVAIARPSGRHHLQAIVSPLRISGELLPAHALVLVADPERTGDLPGDVLRTLYGLTPSEAEIANALLSGRSVAEIAQLRRVTEGTLRVQLKTLLHKTGARRQGELLRLLMSLPRRASEAPDISAGGCKGPP
jgi:DNA-binding CsgD family transcriptional regulator/PAS domain-containing protein